MMNPGLCSLKSNSPLSGRSPTEVPQTPVIRLSRMVGRCHYYYLASFSEDFVDFVTPVGRTYCPTHQDLFPIETSFQAIDQPLSGFSEQSPINSTPINSSSSENSRGRDSAWSPYPSPHHRGRSLGPR